VAFSEVKVAVGPHCLVVAAYRLLFPGGRAAATSFPGSQKRHGWRDASMNWAWARRLTGVPVVVGPTSALPGAAPASDACFPGAARCLADSWACLGASGLPPLDPDTQARFDQVLGPRVRQWAYYHIIATPLYRRVQSCGPLMMAAFDACEALMGVSGAMRRMMDMTAADAANAEAAIREEFCRVSRVLLGGARPTTEAPAAASYPRNAYLGDGVGGGCQGAFGSADLAFSALAAWVVLPEGFHDGECDVPALGELPREVAALVKELRDTPAGRHVRRCYAEHRKHTAA
jgi:hypothetical protein